MAVFISYSRANVEQVRILAEDIDALGHPVWFDKELTGGQIWWDRILEQVRGCNVFVYAISEVSLRSEACQREHAYAVAVGRTVLPVRVDAELSTNLLPPELRSLQLVDYHVSDKRGLLDLARALGQLAPPAHTPAAWPVPLPPAPPAPTSYLQSLRDRIVATAPLTREDQNAIWSELDDALSKEHDRHDLRDLLEMLKERSDLLATTAAKVDRSLARIATVASVRPAARVAATTTQNQREQLAAGEVRPRAGVLASWAGRTLVSLCVAWLAGFMVTAAGIETGVAKICAAISFLLALYALSRRTGWTEPTPERTDRRRKK